MLFNTEAILYNVSVQKSKSAKLSRKRVPDTEEYVAERVLGSEHMNSIKKERKSWKKD